MKCRTHGLPNNAWFIIGFLTIFPLLTFDEFLVWTRTMVYLNGLIKKLSRKGEPNVLGNFLVGYLLPFLSNSFPTNPQSSFAFILLHTQNVAVIICKNETITAIIRTLILYSDNVPLNTTYSSNRQMPCACFSWAHRYANGQTSAKHFKYSILVWAQ